MVQDQTALDALIIEAHQRPVSRISFLRRAVGLGLSATAAATLLGQIEGPRGVQAAAVPAEVSFSSWGSLDEQVTITAVLKAFQKAQPNITVSPLLTSWGNYWPKYNADLAARATSDVQFLTFVPSYASKGALMEIRSLLKKHGQSVPKAYTPALLSIFEWNGGLYGYPRDNDTKVIFYNKKLFRQAGLAMPKSDWTWDDLRAAALKLTKRQGNRVTQYGVAFETGQYRLYFWQSGTELFDNDARPTKVTLNTPKAAAAIQFLADLINKDKVTPPATQIADSSNIGPMFASGQLAMAFGNHALVPTFEKTPGLEWGVVGMPHFKGQKTVNASGGAGYTISKFTKNPDAAYHLWSFITGPVASLMFASGNDMVPVNPEALHSSTWLSKPYNKVFSEQTALGHDFPSFPKWSDVDAVVGPILDKVWVGETTAAAALPKVAAAATKVIKG